MGVRTVALVRLVRRGAVIVLGLAIATAAGIATPPTPTAAAQGGDREVTVADGTLRGKVSGDRREFLNIPYAAPPTGERRFRPPEPPEPWSDVRDATRAGNICPQDAPLPGIDEDCLVLNVYTPRSAAQGDDLPVMVWIHGGAYTFGSGAGYDPRPLVTEGEVIVVSVNYRLGPLGFLALPELAEESQTTGNHAILDQQAGLEWVRDNIGAFGGDAGNVTIFGESAGGHSVCMQLISPRSEGLFHKAITQSGGCVDTDLGPVPTEEAFDRAANLAATVGCTDPATRVSCLRDTPVGDITAASGDAFPTDGLTWVPTIDGTVIEEPTRDALAAGDHHDVPLVVGSNLDEGRLFVTLQWHLTQLRRPTAEELEEQLAWRADEVTPELRETYPPEAPDNADIALAELITDSNFACSALFTAEGATTTPGQTVYQYQFADPEPPLSNLNPLMPMGAYHASELFYLFRTVEGLPLLTGLNRDQRRLSEQMIDYWTTFAHTGDPNGAETPDWPAFAPEAPQAQRLTSEGTGPVTSFAEEHNCHLWR